MDAFLQSLIRDAGTLAKKYFFHDVGKIKTKTNAADLVTEADYAVNDFLIKKILSEYPNHRIHSEELSEDINLNLSGEYEWVIDPIDGTRNFALGIPFWCIIIAVLKQGQPYLAAVYNAIADQLFFARQGGGAFSNGRPIRVNNNSSLDFSFACISYNQVKERNFAAAYQHMTTRFMTQTSGKLYNFGTMLPACHVGSGGIDIFANNAGYDHDYLAPSLICTEAGALVTDSAGNPWARGRRDIVIANPALHHEVMQLFK